MKRSNIALIVSAGVIVLATLVFFSLNKKWEVKMPDRTVQLHSERLEPFRTIVALEGAIVHIEESADYAIAFDVDSAGNYPENIFYVSGDSIFINKGSSVILNCKSIDNILSLDARQIEIFRLNLTELTINMKGGKLAFFSPTTKISIDSLTVQLTDKASLDVRNAHIGVLRLEMKGESKASFRTPIQKAILDLSEKAELRLFQSDIGELDIKKDSSVRLELFNN